MHRRQQEIDQESFEADIEQSKICSQAACRRVSTHCSTLMDALVIFKTWFIQRQTELTSTTTAATANASLSHQSAMQPGLDQNLVPYKANESSSDPNKSVLLADSSLLAERDWAVGRMRRMESQMTRLRNACLAMRVQLEAGLRHKTEVEQVKRDLEMATSTVSHYQNIINEGNKLRDDLRAELARARKEASVARSQLASAQRQVISRPSDLAPEPVRYSDSADTAATLMLSLSPAEATPTARQLHSQLERQTRWCQSLNNELTELRETVRRLTEQEAEHSEELNRIHKYVESTAAQIALTGSKRSRTNPFGSILSLEWLAHLSKLVHVTLPENLTEIACKYETHSHRSPSPPSAKRPRRSSTKVKRKSPPPPPLSPPHATPSGSEFLEQILSELTDIGALDATTMERASVVQPQSPAASVITETSSSPAEHVTRRSPSQPQSPVAPVVTETSSPPAEHLTRRPSSQLQTPAASVMTELSSPPAGRVTRRPSSHASETKVVSHQQTAVDLDEDESNDEKGPTKEPEIQQQPLEEPASSSQSLEKGHSPSPPRSTSPPSIIVPLRSPIKSVIRSPRPIPVKIDENEDVATRVPTCPSGYTRKERPIKSNAVSTLDPTHPVSESLLSLMKTVYPDEIISWFDHVTSNAVLPEINDVTKDKIPSTPVPKLHPSKITKDNRTSYAVPDRLVERPPDDSKLMRGKMSSSPLREPAIDVLTPNSNVTKVAESTVSHKPVDDSQCVRLCTNFLRSKGNSKPPLTLVQLLKSYSPEVSFALLWNTFVKSLSTVRPADMDKRVSQFIALQSIIGANLKPEVIFERFLRHLNDLISPIGVITAVRTLFWSLGSVDSPFVRVCMIKLLNFLFVDRNTMDNFGLLLVPYIVDACHNQLDLHGDPLRDSAACQLPSTAVDDASFSFVVASIQSLLSWHEAYCVVTKKRISSLPDLDKVFDRLRSFGWLPGPRVDSNTENRLAQQNYRIRCLALHLIDACVMVRREGTELMLTNHFNREAASALSLLIRAMAFVFGEDAVPSQPDDASGPSPTRSHQNKRRNRQTQKQQQMGLLGWLLVGRLLPWIVKQTKSMQTNPSQDSGVILERLAVVTTDILVVGSHMFSTNPPPRTLQELRSTVFSTGRRLVQLLTQNSAHLSTPTLYTCALRLIPFAPVQCLSLIVHCDSSKHPSRDVPTSILWDPVPLRSLFELSLKLVTDRSDTEQSLFESFKRICQTIQ